MILPLPGLWDGHKATSVIYNGYGVWNVHCKVLRKPKRTSLILMSFYPSSSLQRRLMFWSSLQPCTFYQEDQGGRCQKDRLQIEFSCCTYTIKFSQNKKILCLKLLFCKIFNITTDNVYFTCTTVSDFIEDTVAVPQTVHTYYYCLSLSFNFTYVVALFHKFLKTFFF